MRPSVLHPLWFTALLLASSASADWPSDPSAPTPVYGVLPITGFRVHVASYPDGDLFVVTIDSLAGGNEIRAQRFDASGARRWGATGTTIAAYPGPLSQSIIPVVAPDGAGGAYVAYTDAGSGSPPAQAFVMRVLANGTLAWGASTPISATGNTQIVRGIMGPSSDGVVVVWRDIPNGGNGDLYAQKVLTNGSRGWGAIGTQITAGAPLDLEDTSPFGCSRGGDDWNVVGWTLLNTGTVYAQALRADGSPQWTAGGLAVAPGFGSSTLPQGNVRVLALDGAAVVTWIDRRNGNSRERLYGQLFNFDGTRLWGDGVMLNRQRAGFGNVTSPVFSSPSGFWFAWAEADTATGGANARAAIVDFSGVAAAPVSGLLISTAPDSTPRVGITPAYAGGLMGIAYEQTSAASRFRGQRIDGATHAVLSHPPLLADGVSGGSLQTVADGSGGAYGVFGIGNQLYAVRFTAGGCLGAGDPVLVSAADVPDDEGGAVSLCWRRACGDTAFTTLYRVLRRPAGTQGPWTESDTYDAIGLEMNCYTGATDADSSGAGAADYEWRIVWDDEVGGTDSSNVLVAHSSDDLAPAPPGNIVVEFHPGGTLAPASGSSPAYNAVRWTASPSPDVASLRLYRDSWPGFTPSPATLAAQLPGTALSHDDPVAHPYYYKLVAVDDAGNVGAAAGAPPVPAGTPSTWFWTDFDDGLPDEFSAPGAAIEPVRGWSGLGHPGNTFAAQFLRYSAQQLHDTRLVLRNLPVHTHVSLAFLLAVIDSWDGTELFRVSVDGQLLFNHWFQLATGDASSYAAPGGSLLSSGTDLGFSAGFYFEHDRAYDLLFEPAFNDIPHTADSLVVVWSLGAVSGGAAAEWQGGTDESWAIDNVRVTLTRPALDAPGAGAPRTLELAGVQPNPSRDGRLRVRFALPSGVGARLELFDVAGRRLESREVGALGPGVHGVDLGGGAPLGTGLYFVRLTQGTERRTTRAVVSR